MQSDFYLDKHFSKHCEIRNFPKIPNVGQTLKLVFQFWHKFSQFFDFSLFHSARFFCTMLTQFSGFGNNFSLRKIFSSVRFFSLVDFLKVSTVSLFSKMKV